MAQLGAVALLLEEVSHSGAGFEVSHTQAMPSAGHSCFSCPQNSQVLLQHQVGLCAAKFSPFP